MTTTNNNKTVIVNKCEKPSADVKDDTRRYSNWCFTDYNLENYEKYQKKFENGDYKNLLNFMVFQKEECPTTKKIHIQGYFECVKRYSLLQVKKRLNDKKIHLEYRRGTQKQAIEYCSLPVYNGKVKGQIGSPIFLGEKKEQGKRSDLVEIYEMIREGCSLQDIVDTYTGTYIRYMKNIKQLFYDELWNRTPKWTNVETTVRWGEAGTGKTRWVYDTYDEKDIYRLTRGDNGGVWFDGYEGQKVLLIDDFYGWLLKGKLFEYLDGNKFRIQVKGGFTTKAWEKVIITSNRHPKEWYRDLNEYQKNALKRRLHKIVKVENTSAENAYDWADCVEIDGEEIHRNNILNDEELKKHNDNDECFRSCEKRQEVSGNTRTLTAEEIETILSSPKWRNTEDTQSEIIEFETNLKYGSDYENDSDSEFYNNSQVISDTEDEEEYDCIEKNELNRRSVNRTGVRETQDYTNRKKSLKNLIAEMEESSSESDTEYVWN